MHLFAAFFILLIATRFGHGAVNEGNFTKQSTGCLRPMPLGICQRSLRYAYNPKTQKCVSFYYTGCGSTENTFLTFEECRRDCMENKIY